MSPKEFSFKVWTLFQGWNWLSSRKLMRQIIIKVSMMFSEASFSCVFLQRYLKATLSNNTSAVVWRQSWHGSQFTITEGRWLTVSVYLTSLPGARCHLYTWALHSPCVYSRLEKLDYPQHSLHSSQHIQQGSTLAHMLNVERNVSVTSTPNNTTIEKWHVTCLLRERNLSRIDLIVNRGFFHCCYLKLLPLTHTLKHGISKGASPAVCGERRQPSRLTRFLFALSVDLWKTHFMW